MYYRDFRSGSERKERKKEDSDWIKNARRDRSKSVELPSDWPPFSDSEPELPGSPKHVAQQQQQQRQLPDEESGAIPKKRPSYDTPDEDVRNRRTRRALRRRQTTVDEGNNDSPQRQTADIHLKILQLLSESNPNQEELNRLKSELESRRKSEDEESRRERRRRRRAARRERSSSSGSNNQQQQQHQNVANALANIFGQGPNTHIATDHEDTTEGAVHCFQDEFGNWHSYTFGPESTGTASTVNQATTSTNSRLLSSMLQQQQQQEPPQPPQQQPQSQPQRTSRSNSNNSVSSGLTVILDSPAMVFQPSTSSRTNVDHSSSPSNASRIANRSLTATTNSSNTNTIFLNPAAISTNFRSHRSPLHLFAESLLERTRQSVTDESNRMAAVPQVRTDDLLRAAGLAQARREVSFGEIVTEDGNAIAVNESAGSNGHHHQHHHHHHHNPGRFFFSDSSVSGPKVKKYYNFKLIPRFNFFNVRVDFDRLKLLTVLDRNITWSENVLSVLLAVVVAAFTALILQTDYYRDLWIFLFCAVSAGCQYSLLKSVQPDSASPTHGFNRVIVFSRPIYFILCCALVLSLRRLAECGSDCMRIYSFYGYSFPTERGVDLAVDIVYGFILCFPIIFLLGKLSFFNCVQSTVKSRFNEWPPSAPFHSLN